MSEIDGMNFGDLGDDAEEPTLDLDALSGRGDVYLIAMIRELRGRVRALEAQIGYEGGVILRLREKLAFARVGSSISNE